MHSKRGTKLKDPLKNRYWENSYYRHFSKQSGPILVKLAMMHDPYIESIDCCIVLRGWVPRGPIRGVCENHILYISSESSDPILTTLSMHDH